MPRRNPRRIGIGAFIAAIVVGVGTAVGVYETHSNPIPPPTSTTCTLSDASGCTNVAGKTITITDAEAAAAAETRCAGCSGGSGFVFNCATTTAASGYLDNWTAPSGTSAFITVTGSGYPVKIVVDDPGPWNVRGVSFGSGCSADDSPSHHITTGDLTSGSATVTNIASMSTVAVGQILYAQNGSSLTKVLPLGKVASLGSSSVTLSPICSSASYGAACSADAISTVTGARLVFNSGIDAVVEVKGDGRTYGTRSDSVKFLTATVKDIYVTGNFDGGPRQCNDSGACVHGDSLQAQGGQNIGLVDVEYGDWDDEVPTTEDAGGAPFVSGSVSPLAGYLVMRNKSVACNHTLNITGTGWGLVYGFWSRSGAPSNYYTGGTKQTTATSNGTTTLALGSGSGWTVGREIFASNSAITIPSGTTIVSVSGANMVVSNSIATNTTGARVFSYQNAPMWSAALDLGPASQGQSTNVKGMCNQSTGHNFNDTNWTVAAFQEEVVDETTSQAFSASFTAFPSFP